MKVIIALVSLYLANFATSYYLHKKYKYRLNKLQDFSIILSFWSVNNFVYLLN